MTIRTIVQLGTPVLRKKAKVVSVDKIASPSIQQLITDLEDTQVAASGIGLSAPQINVGKQVCVIHLPKESPRYKDCRGSKRYVLINPTLKVIDSTLTEGLYEGCLSLPTLRGFVKRAYAVEVNYYDEQANKQSILLEGFLATVFQHEIDHLNGILFIDRMDDLSTLTYLEEYQQFYL